MRTCFVCNGKGSDYARYRFWAEYEFDLRWCENCGLGWVSQVPDESVFADAYERLNSREWRGIQPKQIAKSVRRAYLKGCRVAKSFLHYRADVKKGDSNLAVLEIGSNIGAVLKGVADTLEISPSQTVGVDFSRNHAEVAEEKFGVRTVVSTLGEAAEKIDKRFDLILAHHIIEHDEDPGAFVDALRHLAKPGAILSFELPNGRREAGCIRLDDENGKRPYTLVNHINFFSPQGFGRFLSKHDLKVLHLCTLNANNLLHDFGLWREKHSGPCEVPSLSQTPKTSVLETFPDDAVAEGVRKGRQESRWIHWVHRYLRTHYPAKVPWGRDIEAYAQWGNSH